MVQINEIHRSAITLAVAEAAKRFAESTEIARQTNSTPLFLPSFAGYENARQKGQLAFFKVMGVKCRPLKPAESVRHKGKVFMLSKTHNKEEALELNKKVQKGLKCFRGIRFIDGVRVQ